MLTYLSVWIRHFLGDEEGASAIEYGLIAALIAVGMIIAATALGDGLSSLFGEINTELGNAVPS